MALLVDFVGRFESGQTGRNQGNRKKAECKHNWQLYAIGKSAVSFQADRGSVGGSSLPGEPNFSNSSTPPKKSDAYASVGTLVGKLFSACAHRPRNRSRSLIKVLIYLTQPQERKDQN